MLRELSRFQQLDHGAAHFGAVERSVGFRHEQLWRKFGPSILQGIALAGYLMRGQLESLRL
jgi:hypothetical protein